MNENPFVLRTKNIEFSSSTLPSVVLWPKVAIFMINVVDVALYVMSRGKEIL